MLLHLIGVAGMLYEDKFVTVSSGHVTIDKRKETDRIAIGKVVIGTYQQGTGVSDALHL